MAALFATMGRLDDALDVLQRAAPLNEEVEGAFWQTITETPRNRQPRSSLAK